MKDLINKHFTDGNRELVDQPADSQLIIAEDIFFCIEDLTYFQGGMSLLVGIRQSGNILCNIAVSNPGRGHSFCIQHIHKHTCNRVQIVIVFCRLEFTDNDNSGIINGCNKIPGSGRKNIPNGCQCIFVFTLLGFHKKNCTTDRCGNMKFFSTIKSIHLGIGT